MKPDRIPLGDQAKGKWRGILPHVGVDAKYLVNQSGPCPICQAGKTRFRFDDKEGKGTWISHCCGAGDGVSLVMKVNNWDFKTAAREIEKHVGNAPAIAIRNGRDPAEVKREMNDIWLGGKPLDSMDPTALWWSRRIGEVPRTTELRAVRSLRCPGHPDHSGMVALIRGLDGKPVNLHRTYLTSQGHKADIPEPRRVMDIGLPKGSAVRLSEPTDTLGIAEGLETAESCRILFGVPTWAALNAENMKGWMPPIDGLRIVVFGDNDKSLTGHEASYTLARKLRAKGHAVEVRIPETEGHDWNDHLLAKLADEGRRAMADTKQRSMA